MGKQAVRARLYDLLHEQVCLPPLPNRDHFLSMPVVTFHNAWVQQLVAGAKVVEATNVSKYFEATYLGKGDSGVDQYWRDLKCLAPPYPKLWIEWDDPLVPRSRRMGVLLWTVPVEQAAATLQAIYADDRYRELARGLTESLQKFVSLRTKWVSFNFEFLEFEPAPQDYGHLSNLRGPFNMLMASIAEDGDLLDWSISVSAAHGSLAHEANAELRLGNDQVLPQEENGLVMASSMVAWTALALMNCANIDRIEHSPPEGFQKARRKKGRRPLVSYHTVQVNMSKTPRSIAAPSLGGDGVSPRLHEKRGHMKDYRKGRGLFGRYKGLWYWGPQLVGSGEAGVVVSDYEVVDGT